MEKPAVFIASSVEGLSVADAINVNLDHDAHCTLWRNGTFKLGSDGLDDLIKKSSAVDFAVFVFTPDDVLKIRDRSVPVARDNVVFELGLFIGALGKDRCYVIQPRDVEMHLPSDVAGVTTGDYVADRPDGDVASALNAACKLVKDRIQELGRIPRAASSPVIAAPRRVANPPDYKLSNVDLEFLAQCVRSHVAYPNGLAYSWISGQISDEYFRIALAAVKLMRLGYIEKAVELDPNDEPHFCYSATEDGLDALLKHESHYEHLQAEKLAQKQSPRHGKPKSGFDDMDEEMPF